MATTNDKLDEALLRLSRNDVTLTALYLFGTNLFETVHQTCPQVGEFVHTWRILSL